MGNFADRYTFAYIFSNKTNGTVAGFKLSLTTKNNSDCGYGWSPYDGDVDRVFAKPGELKKVILAPNKHVFIPNGATCREKPYNDIIVENIYKRMMIECTKTCKPCSYWICMIWKAYSQIVMEIIGKGMKKINAFMISIKMKPNLTTCF